jgi:hypothetical protein
MFKLGRLSNRALTVGICIALSTGRQPLTACALKRTAASLLRIQTPSVSVIVTCGSLRAPSKTKVEHMARNTILYVSYEATCSNSVLAALRAAGYDVLSTNGSTQAIALLFVMQSVAAVVLSYPAKMQAGFDEARSLRSICPDVPIVLMCRDQIAHAPSCVDAFVSTRQPLERLATAVRCLLAGKRAFRCPRLSGLLARATG